MQLCAHCYSYNQHIYTSYHFWELRTKNVITSITGSFVYYSVCKGICVNSNKDNIAATTMLIATAHASKNINTSYTYQWEGEITTQVLEKRENSFRIWKRESFLWIFLNLKSESRRSPCNKSVGVQLKWPLLWCYNIGISRDNRVNWL